MSISFQIKRLYEEFPTRVAVTTLAISSGNNVVWDFGDGNTQKTSNSDLPLVHKYASEGMFFITATEYHNDTYIAKAVVSVKAMNTTKVGIGENETERTIVAYGNNNEQGYGWSDEGGDGSVWTDTIASNISIFDNNEDSIEVSYDYLTGLPYITNPRKSYGGSKILDAWKDKIDPTIEGSGEAIRTRVRLQEFLGSHESFQQKMSDISLFFSPIYKENQGKDGYNSDGLLENMKTSLELYKDDLLDEKAHAVDIPMKTELYFDRAIQGNVLQLAFETTEAEYRFTRGECQLTDYDKARSPFKDGMSEKDYQLALSDVEEVWITRGGLFNRLNRQVIDGIEIDNSDGADGKAGSSFKTTQEVALGNASTGGLFIVAKSSAPLDVSQTLIEFDRWGDWYAFYYNGAISNIKLKDGVSFFDVRLLKDAPSREIIEYAVNDIKQNSGNSIYPRF